MNWEKVKEHFFSNVFSVFWSALLLIGGGVFVSYYGMIGYMPDFDLKSSVAITAAAAVTSILLVMGSMLMMVFPGIFWSGVWKESFVSELGVKSFWENKGDGASFFWVMFWFSIPVLSLLPVPAWFFFDGGCLSVLFLIIPAMFFLGCYFYFYIFRNVSGWKSFIEVFVLAFSSFMSLVFLVFPLFIVFLVVKVRPELDGDVKLFYLISLSLFVIFVNVLSAAPYREGRSLISWFFVSCLGFVALFVITGVVKEIPKEIMRVYKFGNVEASELVVGERGCELLGDLEVRAFSKKSGNCVLLDAKILSRLGREVYIEISDGESESLRFTVPSSYVLSWSLRDG